MQKRIQWVVMTALLLASPASYALGLGSAKIKSYLNQPLDVRVELISQNSEELQSITVGLASAKDFELLGLKLNAISVPLDFEIVTQGGQSFIHITSNLNVSDPVMQVLVEVVWANGRMLREYTLFLDPPTLGSKAPAPQVSKQPVVVPATPAQPQTATVQSPPLQSTPIEPSAPQSTSASSSSVAADDLPSIKDEEDSSRVGKGQTLWGIASDWSKGTGYNVNQAMLAIQRKNPDAFIDGNINLLKQGEILRMPASNEMAEITSQQAALEVQRQTSEFNPGLTAPDFDTPTVADSGDYQETFQDEVAGAEEEFVDGRLEIVPPSDSAEDASGAISQASDEVTADDVNGQVLQEKLTRTEEDLINAELENSYLKDRIAELESVADTDQGLQVQDADLANMETAMADKQASNEPKPAVALTPGGEQQPWYAGVTIWLIAAALFLILIIVWFLRKRSRSASESLQEMENRSTVQAVTDDAEDLLDILDNYGASSSSRKRSAHNDEEALELEEDFDTKAQGTLDTESNTVVAPILASVSDQEDDFEQESSDVEELDSSPEPVSHLPDESTLDADDVGEIKSEQDDSEEDTNIVSGDEPSDPELKLDLARAYLSLGDNEAAKSMLDEVLLNGNKEQVAEAEQMLDEL